MDVPSSILQFASEWGIRFLHASLNFLRGIPAWAKTVRDCDVSAWAIAFTMNTWAASLGRVRFQMHGAIRKAIDESRAKAKQGRLLERLAEMNTSEGEKCRKIGKKFDKFLSKLEKFDAKYPKIGKDCQDTPIATLPLCILVFSAGVSLLCILFGWFYNFTLIVLFPYPVIFGFYLWRKWSVPHFIEKRYAKLEADFDRAQNVTSQDSSALVADLTKRMNALGGGQAEQAEQD